MKHFFYQGGLNLLENNASLKDYQEYIQKIKTDIEKVVEIRNLSFLLGSGCSAGIGGVPTMQQLAENFFLTDEKEIKKMSPVLQTLILNKECKTALNDFDIKWKEEPFVSNIETFLGTLYSLKYYFEQIKNSKKLESVDKVIKHTKNFILYESLNIDNRDNDLPILETYKSFYRKLSLRDSNLPKPNVFTTNYDLYSEKAMDDLGITYTNGFSGFIDRYFNPSIFNYALAEQMDISSFKWSIIDSFIYLFKIHGSVNWIEEPDSNKLFRIKELQDSDFNKLREEENLLIYPSPIKQNASLGTPYSDLFREFQKRITQKQSVLITMGYSFGDEHINNLIYQALTIPTFRLVIFSGLGYYAGEVHIETKTNINRLRKLNDPRIWIIGSDKEYTDDRLKEEIKKEDALFHFNVITKDILPDWSDNQIEDKNKGILDLIKSIDKTVKPME